MRQQQLVWLLPDYDPSGWELTMRELRDAEERFQKLLDEGKSVKEIMEIMQINFTDVNSGKTMVFGFEREKETVEEEVARVLDGKEVEYKWVPLKPEANDNKH